MQLVKEQRHLIRTSLKHLLMMNSFYCEGAYTVKISFHTYQNHLSLQFLYIFLVLPVHGNTLQ